MKSAGKDMVEQEQMRVRLVLVIMLLAFVFLIAAMWRIQVNHGQFYERDLDKQSIRRVRVPGMRGRIYDRKGICLADNRPSYCIAVYLEELKQPGGWSKTIQKVESMLHDLSELCQLPLEISHDQIVAHVRKRLPLPLLVWRDIDDASLARFSERVGFMPGIDVYVEALRVYPLEETACHVLGLVGRAEQIKNDEEPYHYYLPEWAGKSGVERKMDGVLRGEEGGRLVRVDVSGYRHEDLAQRDPHSGSDVLLALDLTVQKLAEEALGDEPGSVVIVDPDTGDVLALANAPGFNPNAFIPSISKEKWDPLIKDPDKPFLNRAVSGAYPPGSTFKPVVAMSALENKKATIRTVFDCPGFFDLGNSRFHCWKKEGHGMVNMQDALKVSCNVFFYRIGLQSGYECIYHMAAALGLGQETGITIDVEVNGLLPSDAWSRRVHGHGWRAGDTCNLCIGQGALLATPLQMAMVTATLANGGQVYRPRLVKGIRAPGERHFRAIPPQKVNEMNWSKTSLEAVRSGMKEVVMSQQGSGRLAYVPGLVMAAKTGTAEYGRKDQGKKRGWMIAFAPFEKPRFAVAFLLENVESGGLTVAPKLKQLMEKLCVQPEDREGKG